MMHSLRQSEWHLTQRLEPSKLRSSLNLLANAPNQDGAAKEATQAHKASPAPNVQL